MEPDQLKRDILKEAFGEILDKAKVPARYHLKVVETLHAKMAEQSKERKAHEEQIARHESQLSIHDQHDKEHERQISEWDETSKHLTSIEHLKGDQGEPGMNGEDGISPNIEEIVQAVLPRLPSPKDGEPGTSGKDADEDKILDKLIKRLQKEKPLDISHIRNAQTFMKDGIKYKIEELMKGGGTTTGGSGLNYIALVSGSIDNTNTTFTFAKTPTIIVVNGSSYINGAGVTITGTTGVIASPAGVGGSVYAIG